MKNLVVDDGKAAIEVDFVGTHTGEFGGVPATGKNVQVPYSAVYDVEDDKISGLRLYVALDLIVQQIS